LPERAIDADCFVTRCRFVVSTGAVGRRNGRDKFPTDMLIVACRAGACLCRRIPVCFLIYGGGGKPPPYALVHFGAVLRRKCSKPGKRPYLPTW